MSFIYFDNNSTTQVDPRVLDKILPYFSASYANASSTHRSGKLIAQSIDAARECVADLIGSRPAEIVFTSGSTEALNLAIRGIVDASNGARNHVITVQSEHLAVLDTCRYLESRGIEVSYVNVGVDGLLDLDAFNAALSDRTLFVAVMLVNNETGVIQSLREISELAHEKGVYVLSDTTQAVGRTPVDVDELGLDLMCFSAHKFYGPKGAGGLFYRRSGEFKVRLQPMTYGGGHEHGLRSGTLNVSGIVGMGRAAEIASQEMTSDAHRIRRLRDDLERNLLRVVGAKLNGHKEHRLFNVSNICFEGVDAEALIMGLGNIAVSNGAACSSNTIEPSHVLTSMGLTREDAYSSIRFSLGRFNTANEITEVSQRVTKLVNYIRQQVNV